VTVHPEIRCYVGATDAAGKPLSPTDRVRLEIRFPGPALPCPGDNQSHFGWVELSADHAAALAQILTACAIAAARQEQPAFVGPTSRDIQQDAVDCLRDLHDLLDRTVPHDTNITTNSPEVGEDIATRLNRARELLALLPDTRPAET
jgi:hypothetical protein